MARGRLSGLDSLRGIAAVVVLTYHVLAGYGTNGFLAVDFFFMLSGYVMARTYEHRLGEPGAGGRFVMARIERLWPPMVLASLVGLPWLWWHVPDRALHVAIANLLLLPTPTPDDIYLLNPPAWSILFELIANGVHAAILWRLSNRQLVGLLAVLVPLLTWFAFAYTMHMVTPDHLFTRGMVRLLCPYVIGVLLYRCWRDEPPLRVPPAVSWALLPAFFIGGNWLWGSVWLPDLLFVLVLCPLAIAGGLTMPASRLGSWLGAISFPLYAIHGPLLMLMREFGWSLPVQFVFALGGGIAFTSLLAGIARLMKRVDNSAPAVLREA